MLRLRFSHRVLLLPTLAAVSFLLLVFVHHTAALRNVEILTAIPGASTASDLYSSALWSTVVMIAISGVGILALVALAAQVITSTSGPLARAASLADRLSQGDLSWSVPPTDAKSGAPEELDELMTTMGRLVRYLRGV